MKLRTFSLVFAIAFSLFFTLTISAQITVTASNQQGWASVAPIADTRHGGVVNFVKDLTSPAPFGALELAIDGNTGGKAQYMHRANVPLREVTQLGYYTKYVSGPTIAAASYQLPVMLCGTSGFTTMVFEPYQNGTVSMSNWQYWDVDTGQMWSSRTVSCTGNPNTVTAGGGGAPFYTLAQLKQNFPAAVVVGFGANMGSNNPLFRGRVDLFDFNKNVYDFELYDASDCKNNGWMTLTEDDLSPFGNQGECISYVNANIRSN